MTKRRSHFQQVLRTRVPIALGILIVGPGLGLFAQPPFDLLMIWGGFGVFALFMSSQMGRRKPDDRATVGGDGGGGGGDGSWGGWGGGACDGGDGGGGGGD